MYHGRRDTRKSYVITGVDNFVIKRLYKYPNSTSLCPEECLFTLVVMSRWNKLRFTDVIEIIGCLQCYTRALRHINTMTGDKNRQCKSRAYQKQNNNSNEDYIFLWNQNLQFKKTSIANCYLNTKFCYNTNKVLKVS